MSRYSAKKSFKGNWDKGTPGKLMLTSWPRFWQKFFNLSFSPELGPRRGSLWYPFFHKKNGLVLAISKLFLLWVATGIYIRNPSFSARALFGELARRTALVASWTVKHQGTKGQASPGNILAIALFPFVSWNRECTAQPITKCQCQWWGRWEAERSGGRHKVHKMQICGCET